MSKAEEMAERNYIKPRPRPAAMSAAILLCFLTSIWKFVCPAYALDPSKRLTQYMRNSWRIQDGSLPAGMTSITQTSDGFLWFTSTSQVLYRFDGVKFVTKNLSDESRTIDHIGNIRADNSGGLWAIGGESEVLQVKGREVTSHFPVDYVGVGQSMSIDPDGSLWVLQASPSIDKPLCHISDRAIKCFGKSEGVSIPGGRTIIADGKRGFWLGGQTAIVHWHNGISETYPIENLEPGNAGGVAALALGPNDTLWVGMDQEGHGFGLGRMEQGNVRSYTTPGFDGSKLSVSALTIDHDGNLWVGTFGSGLFRIHEDTVEHYGRQEGLSADTVTALFEDREGLVWVSTTNGIDSFRDPAVTTFSAVEGLGPDLAFGVLASRDGSVWVANGDSLDHIERNGSISSIRWGKGLPGDQVTAMLEDRSGKLWIGVGDGLYLLEKGRFHRISEPDHKPFGLVVGLAEDIDGNIWAECSGELRRLVRIRDLQVREQFSPPNVPAGRLAADPHGGIWIGTRKRNLTLFRNGILQNFPINSNADLYTNDIRVQPDGSVLAAFDDGLLGLRKDKIQRMTTKNGLPCDTVFSIIEDKEKHWWLNTNCGIVMLPDSELNRWWANPEVVVQTRVYDALDGVRSGREVINPAALSTDGRVWFATGFFVQMVDPSRLAQKAPPAMTYIESIIVDRKEYAESNNLKLPANPRDLQIDYTSPTFAILQKVKFRYRLDGYDRDWHDAGTRRQAFFTDLPPGDYSFRVIASNVDGVWSEKAATLNFSIAAAFYQTNWFRVLCVIFLLFFFWGIHQLRMQRLKRNVKQLRDVIETIPAMAWTALPDGSNAFVNSRWAEYTGLSAEATAGSGWMAAVHPEDLPLYNERWRTSIMTGQPFEYEARFRYAPNGQYRSLLARSVPVRDEHGNIRRWYGIFTDIEDRKRAEEASRRGAVLEATNKELEAFAYSISHDLRAPLRHLAGFAELLFKRTADSSDEKSIHYMSMILDAAKRMGILIDDLLGFSRVSRAEIHFTTVNLDQIVQEAVAECSQDLKDRNIAWKIQSLGDWQGDRSMLRLALVNLISNAVKFTRAKTHAEIEIGCSERTEDHIILFVRDNGVGFDMKYYNKLFGVFQRLHSQEAFEGTGIGLATVQRIVHRHGGEIWAKSAVDAGTTFYFSLGKMNH